MEEKISYQLKKSPRAKRLRLAVYADGRVIITSPWHVPNSLIEKFWSEKKDWVLKKLQFFNSLEKKSGRTFSKADYKKYKDQALQLITDRINYYNQFYKFSFKKISVKNQKSRWGSCSRKKNLNLNYRLLFLSEKQRDYIIVHELCHLQEFNHSKKFWALVQKTIPDYVKIRKELRGWG